MEEGLIGWLMVTGGLFMTYCAVKNRRPVNTAFNWIQQQVTGTKGTRTETGTSTSHAGGIGSLVPGLNAVTGWLGDTSGNLAHSPAMAAFNAIAFAQQQIGKPYGYGGAGPALWDCSGLTQQAYRAGGVSLPRTATAQYEATKSASVSPDTPGALVFYGSPAFAHHVGISIGGGQMIDAPHTGADVRVEPYAAGDLFAATFPPAIAGQTAPGPAPAGGATP